MKQGDSVGSVVAEGEDSVPGSFFLSSIDIDINRVFFDLDAKNVFSGEYPFGDRIRKHAVVAGSEERILVDVR